MSKLDIKINQIDKTLFDKPYFSRLSLNIKGSDVNYTLINSLRRAAIDYVPVYRFHPDHCNITTNTSIYFNDYMKKRLSMISINNIKNDIYYLQDKYWKNNDISSPDRLKHPDDTKILDMYVNTENTSNDIMNVITNDVKLYENGVELTDKFKSKCLIIKLKPGQKFNCHAIGILGITKIHGMFRSCHCYYKYEKKNDNNIDFHIESTGDYDEYEILHKSCFILKEKLRYSLELIKQQKFNDDTIEIVLENEDHTLGILINYYLQKNNKVLFSGMAKPNLNIDEIHIKLQVKNKLNAYDVYVENINHIIKIIDNIQNTIHKLGKKYINYKF